MTATTWYLFLFMLTAGSTPPVPIEFTEAVRCEAVAAWINDTAAAHSQPVIARCAPK